MGKEGFFDSMVNFCRFLFVIHLIDDSELLERNMTLAILDRLKVMLFALSMSFLLQM